MKQLAASADIVEVRAAIKEFAESSDRFAIRVAELRRAASALVAEISAVMKEARRAVHPQEIAAVLERAEAFEQVVVERRALLTRQRELTQAATKELQALTATNDFAVVQKGVMKYVDWIDFDEGTRRAYGQVHEHWEKLLDGVRAKLRELCSEDDPRAITATLKEMEGFNWKGYEAREGVESVSEIIDAAEARCEALTSACRGAMEKMAANEEASVREIDEMMARYEGWANVGEQRGMLEKALEACVVRTKEQIESLLQATVEQVGKVDKLLKDVELSSGGHKSLLEPMEDLYNVRRRLEEEMLSQIDDAMLGEDPKAMASVLERGQHFGQSLAPSLKALAASRDEIVTHATARIALISYQDYHM